MSRTSRDVARVTRKLDSNADKLMRSVCLEVLKRVKNRTPVDTGRARNNWNVSKGHADPSTTEDTSDTALQRATPTIAGLEFGDTAYIVNGLPYIKRLENGWSQQAPHGMVRLTVAELKPWIDAQVRRLA